MQAVTATLADVGRPKNNDYPAYMRPDGDRGGFIVFNPLTGKRRRFKAEQKDLAEKVALKLAELVEVTRQKDLLDAGKPRVSILCERWLEERLPLQPWDDSTRATARWRVARIREEMGERLIEDTDCLWLETWLEKTAQRADPFNKWRAMLVHLWRFGVAKKLTHSDEASKVERRSTSRKIKSNQKSRQQLDVKGFQDVYTRAPAFLQLAMELALVTLQARKEVCSIKHTDFKDGFLFVIRDKVAGDSAMAFIKIQLTSELEALRVRALKLDGYVSPYLVHRSPARRQRRWMDGKLHWTYVNERYLTQAFAEARDQVERFAALPDGQRPTFHEIRGLGSRLYLERGIPKAAIQALMTHASPRTTEIYLERGATALTADDYQTVSAPFTVRELLGA